MIEAGKRNDTKVKTEVGEKESKEAEQKKVGKFNYGDHMVHVFLQTGRKFMPEDKTSTTVNIQVSVQVGNQKQYFECKNEVVADSDKPIFWNEHLYFNLPGLDPSKAADTDITIRVLNKGFFRNQLIGEYSTKMSTVYFKEAHRIEHIWMGLSNPDSENFTQVKGLLKASFSVQGPNDEQPKLEPQVGPENAEVILMNSQLKRTFKQLKLSILQCHDLPLFSDRLEQMKNWSLAKTIEVQVQCSYGGGKGYKTEIAKSSKGIISTIDQVMYIPIPEPMLQDRLLLTFKDINVASENMIGSIALSLKEMIDDHKAKKSKFIWKDIIGAPIEGHNNEEMQKRMNEHPEVGNSWKGKVLMHFEFEDTDKPLKQVKPIDPVIKKEAEKTALKEEEFELLMEIGQGVGMPDDYQYQISVNVRNTSKSSKPSIYVKNNYCYWNDRIEIPSFKLLTADEFLDHKRQPHVFIYLMKQTKPIAYKKLKLQDFMKHDAEWQWRQLEKCPVMDEIKEDYMTGMINFKLSIVKKVAGKSLVSQPTWQNEDIRNLKSYWKKKIRCYIFQCRGLPPADEEGVSDPQIQIFSHLGEDQFTPVVEDNLNPMFMCCRSIDFHFKDKNNLLNSAPIIMNIYDVDEGLISDSKDYIGRTVIFLKGASFGIDPNTIPTPKWHQIRVGTKNTDPPCGEILCSFSVYNDSIFVKKESQIDVAATVQKQEYDVNINVLGLRNLKSSGLLPIQKAFIKMHIKSMLPPGQLGVEDKTVQIAEGGSNPNFNREIDFKIDLPVDQLYCPVMTCTVMDQVFIGFSQPIVGNFVIHIGEIKTRQKKLREVFKVTGETVIANLMRLKAGEDPYLIEELDLHCIALNVDRGISCIKAVVKPQSCDLPVNESPLDQNFENSQRSGPNLDQRFQLSAKNQVEETLPEEIEDDAPKLIDPKLNEMSSKDFYKMKTLQDAEKKQEKKSLKDQLKSLIAENGWTIDDNILVPEYEWDELLGCWREKPIPDTWQMVFKTIGYNTPEQVKQIMEYYEQREETDDPEKKAKLYAKIMATTTMHYRRIFKDELENNKHIFYEKAFQSIPIMHGQSRGNKAGGFLSFFEKQEVAENGQITTEKQVGTFKGTINVFTKTEIAKAEQFKKDLIKQIAQILEDIYQEKAPESLKQKKDKLNFELQKYLDSAKARQSFNALLNDMKCNFEGFVPFLQSIYNESVVAKQMRTKTQTQVHIYMIEGQDLASRDIGSESDPYFAITCGTFKFDNRDRYKLDNSNPKWGEHVSFPVTFPGTKPLEIECYDYDDLFGDDLIGTTIIDLDDRFFCHVWQILEEYPLEHRQIYHPSTTLSQGVVEMWLDIVPEAKIGTASSKVWDVKPQPEKQFELRVSVFGIKNLPEADVEGTTDAYIRAFIDDNYVQETDTHYRCTTGNPNFNYRLLFNVKTPLQQPQILSLQAWDRDLIKSNDLLCEWCINLTEFIKDSVLVGNIVNMEQKYVQKSLKPRIQEEDGSIPFKFVSSPEVGIKGYTVELTTFAIDDKLKKKPITIELDIRVLPKEKAEATKVGVARSDPNNDPFLPEPKGRFQLSLNPFTFLNQMCGAKMRCKIYCAIVSLLCCILLIYFMPFISAVISIIVTAASTPAAKK